VRLRVSIVACSMNIQCCLFEWLISCSPTPQYKFQVRTYASTLQCISSTLSVHLRTSLSHMVHVLAYSGQHIYTHWSTSIINIENSIEISCSGEYATGLHLFAPSASYLARLLGLTNEHLVDAYSTEPQYQPPGSTGVRTDL
jgi:hypothetical protein